MSTEPAAEPEPSGPDPAPIRVFLVDDHALFRSGVRAELGRTAEQDELSQESKS